MRNEPIILAGCYRSGTTLLRNIVNEHPNIHCGPEVKFFEDFYGTFLNDPLKHKRFFKSVQSLKVPKRKVLKIFGNAYVKTLQISTRRSGKKRWADKNPENVLYLNDWDFLLDGNFKYVFILRHPLDTLASLVEIGFNKSLPKAYSEKLEIVNKFISEGYKYYKDNPQKSYLIRYENLIAKPETELESLFSFLDEKFDKSIIDKVFEKNARAGIGDPKFKKTTKIHVNSLDRWKKDLSEDQRLEAVYAMGALIKELGYSYEV